MASYDEIYSFSFKNKKEKEMLDAFIKAVKLSFKTIKMDKQYKDSQYSTEFIEMIKKGEEDFKNGNYIEIRTKEERRKLLGLDEK